jgi:hypothetical protein
VQRLVEMGAPRFDDADGLSWHGVPENKKPGWPTNANRAVPVLAEFVKRPQAELKSARLARQRAADDT